MSAFAYVAVQLPYADLETLVDLTEELGVEFCPSCGEWVEVETRLPDGRGECPICYGRTVEQSFDSLLTPGGGA